jgi:hypothetical protein
VAPANLAPRPRYAIAPGSAASAAAAAAAAAGATASCYVTPIKTIPGTSGGTGRHFPSPVKLAIPLGTPKQTTMAAAAAAASSATPSTPAAIAAASTSSAAAKAKSLVLAAASAAGVAGETPGRATAAIGSASSPPIYADGDHVTIWNRIEKRKIAGNAAPLGKNLQKYLDLHPDCEVYHVQDHELSGSRSGRKRQRGEGEMAAAGDHVAIWNKKEQRKIAGNAAPLLKNLVSYLAKRPDCEPYDFQDQELKKEAQRRKIIAKASSNAQAGAQAGAVAAAAAYAAAMASSGMVGTPALFSPIPLSITAMDESSRGSTGAEHEAHVVAAVSTPANYAACDASGTEMSGGMHAYMGKFSHIKDEEEFCPLRDPSSNDDILPEMGLDAWQALESDYGGPTKTELETAAEFFLHMDLPTGNDDDDVQLAILTGPDDTELLMPEMNGSADLIANALDTKVVHGKDLDMSMDDDLDDVIGGIPSSPPSSFAGIGAAPLSGF